MPEGNPLEPGSDETSITRRIDDALAVLGDLAETAPLVPADAHVVVTRHPASTSPWCCRPPGLGGEPQPRRSSHGTGATGAQQDAAGEAITHPDYESRKRVPFAPGLQAPRRHTSEDPPSQDSLTRRRTFRVHLAAKLESEIESADAIDLVRDIRRLEWFGGVDGRA